MNDYILDMTGVSIKRGKNRKVLDIGRFSVRPGELVAVVGPNGAGKSTLLHTINLLLPYQGTMMLFGQDAGKAEQTMLRRRSAMVFQDTLLVSGSVYSNVALSLKFRGVASGEVKVLVNKALEDCHCRHLASRSVHSLSGGEAKRVCLARALVSSPEVLLLDEPFNSLDAATRGEMIEVIRNVAKKRGITVLLVSHNFADIVSFAERAVVLLDGRVIQDARPEVLMRRPADAQVARLVGIDNVIPCSINREGQKPTVSLACGINFVYNENLNRSVSVCCIPGDAFYLLNEKTIPERESVIVIEGIVEQIIPGVGTNRILVKVGEMVINAVLPREQVADRLHEHAKIRLAFYPTEAHLV